jgi:hypothetical protein
MHNGIFISYRRKDTEGEASRLARDLANALPRVPLFRDVEAISPGEDFVAALERALSDCAVMLVMIGPIWLEVADNNGRRRLDDPRDWTRLEVAGALRRGIRVIPVLCRGAVLPTDADLPDDLDALVNRQAVQIDNNRWDYDVDRLIDSLARALNVHRAAPAAAAEAAAPAALAVAPAKGGLAGWIKGSLATLAVLAALLVYGVVSELQELGTVDPETFRKAVTVAAQVAAETSPPPPARAAAPARGAQPVAAAAPALPNLSGQWRSNSELWSIHQQGSELVVAVRMNGVDFGSGVGLVEGNQVGFRLQVQLPIGPVDVACGGVVVNDRFINGHCSSIGGGAALQLVR